MSMRRIVACGGGNPTTSSLPLFEAGLDLTGASKPNILLIPTAKYTKEAHDKIVGDFTDFAEGRGLKLHVLHEFGQLPSLGETAELLEWADAAYFTGGNTRYMMQRWRDSCLESLLYCAVNDGDITAIGTSAGYLAWCNSAQSDSEKYEVPEAARWGYTEVECTGMLDMVGGVHHDELILPRNGQLRKIHFQQMLRKHPQGTVGVAADSSVAMRIVGNKVTVLSNGRPGFLHRMEVLNDGGKLSNEAVLPDPHEEFPLSLFTRVTS